MSSPFFKDRQHGGWRKHEKLAGVLRAWSRGHTEHVSGVVLELMRKASLEEQATAELAARERAEAEARRVAAEREKDRVAERRRQIIEEAQAAFRSDEALWAPAQIESTARVEVAAAIRNRLPERAFQARLLVHADEIADGWWTALARAEPTVAGVVAGAYLHRSSEHGIDAELAAARDTVAAWRAAKPVVAFDGDEAPGMVAERDHRTVRDVGWRKIGALARALRDKFLALVRDAVRRAQGGRGLVAPTPALPAPKPAATIVSSRGPSGMPPPAAWSDPEVQPGLPAPEAAGAGAGARGGPEGPGAAPIPVVASCGPGDGAGGHTAAKAAGSARSRLRGRVRPVIAPRPSPASWGREGRGARQVSPGPPPSDRS